MASGAISDTISCEATTDGVARLDVVGIKACRGERATVSGLNRKSLTLMLDF